MGRHGQALRVGPPTHGSGGPLVDDPAELVGFANPELIFDTSAGTGQEHLDATS
ncbi:hypothetical protein [Rhodococcus erythropolis]|uniref:hypothetical protein n=1 Tax=Rhodococcus erythropolis TaxID=1833 RepID=UPI0024B660FC|nr:hypothetical protein [Rhodococcus erythropolis]MDJ0012008.1 hypothetical protein [Rhodococcus erythropolis]